MNKVYGWHHRVACRTLEGTAFVLLSGRMLSLNAVGTRIWELFENGATVDDVAAQVVDEFETSLDVAKTDTENFVEQLLERDLLIIANKSNNTGQSGVLPILRGEN